MSKFGIALDLIFGCHHSNLSRVFTIGGESYRVCCECGARFGYSLETMSIGSREPNAPSMEKTAWPSLRRLTA